MNKSPKLSAIFIHDADSILPDSNSRTLECVILCLSSRQTLRTLQTTINCCFGQLSKLLKSYVSSQGSTFSKDFRVEDSNHIRLTEVVWNSYQKYLENGAIPGFEPVTHCL